MSFRKKCREIFDKAAQAIKDACAPHPHLQPIPVRARHMRHPRRTG
jgi:hypothetical protein